MWHRFRTKRRTSRLVVWSFGRRTIRNMILKFRSCIALCLWSCVWLLLLPKTRSACKDLNYCSGHGVCSSRNLCTCDEGWGSPTDIATYKSPDCSLRVCASGMQWGSLATTNTSAHTTLECSGNGLCNRYSGVCDCNYGFFGKSCERRGCPNGCSGHGVCKSMRQLAGTHQAAPLSANTIYSQASGFR
jgi:hypothetical protein